MWTWSLPADATTPAFPDPYLQPVSSRDCSYYTTAYLARCLGHPDVTAEQVMAWRDQTRRHEDRYIEQALGIESRAWWADVDNDAACRRWWLGADGADWVREWITDGWIGYASVHRVDFMTHAVAVLDATEDGVLLMDPVYGHVIEPWDWFLGIGAGTYGCHHISTWHRREAR